jgi:hypothetical protein
MLCSASRSSSKILELEDIERAISFLHEAEIDMPQVFSGVGANPLAAVQSRLSTLVRQHKSVAISTVAQMLADDASATQLMESIQSLQQQGKVRYDLVNQKLTWIG